MYPVCTRPLTCMLLGFEAMHLPPNVALFALEDNQSSAKALEPTILWGFAPASHEAVTTFRRVGKVPLRTCQPLPSSPSLVPTVTAQPSSTSSMCRQDPTDRTPARRDGVADDAPTHMPKWIISRSCSGCSCFRWAGRAAGEDE